MIEQRFRSVTEWLAFLRTPIPNPELEQASIRVSSEHTIFTSTRSFDEAFGLAERGWKDGISRVERMVATLDEQIITMLHVPEVVWDVEGDMIDIGRHVAGEPEDFVRLEPAEVEQAPKILHLVVNICTSGIISGETMIRKGAAVVALIDALERHGKRVIVDCLARTMDVCTWVRVKESEAPVQMANLVFMLAHPATLRRLMFNSWEHLDYQTRLQFGFHEHSGYGRVREADDEQRGDIYVYGMDARSRYWHPDEAVPWVLSQLDAQGIHVAREQEV